MGDALSVKRQLEDINHSSHNNLQITHSLTVSHPMVQRECRQDIQEGFDIPILFIWTSIETVLPISSQDIFFDL